MNSSTFNNQSNDATSNFLKKAGFRPHEDSFDDDLDADEEMKFDGLKTAPIETGPNKG